jgi:6-phosphogluconolactonase (cycloisomerase 2 family)
MADRLKMFIGRYTRGDDSPQPGPGIIVAEFDPRTLAIEPVGGAYLPEVSFLALSTSHDVLYAVREEDAGQVAGYAIGAGRGELTPLGAQPTYGSLPCHLALHRGGRFLLAANYNSGSLSVLPVGTSGAPGELSHLVGHVGSGPDPERQTRPHTHMVAAAPRGGAYLATDLGSDSVYVYRLDASAGRLEPVAQNRMRAGTGPRHLVFHPSGEYLYLANELSNTVTVCGYDPEAGRIRELMELPSAPDPEDARNYPSGIILSGDARYAYLANRGDESISVFEVSSAGDGLRPAGRWPCEGGWPRHIALSPDGAFLFCANQRSHDVAVLRVEDRGAGLAPTGASLAVNQPAHVLVG